MNFGSFGDMAQSYMLRSRTAEIKADIQRYSSELSTGRVADVRSALSGNYSFLTDVERKTEVLAGYDVATSEASHLTSAMQLALGRFGDLAGTVSGSLMNAGVATDGVNPTDMSKEARDTLDAMFGTLNSDFAGRHMFSGNATDAQPLLDTDTLMAELSTAMAGATTPADMRAAAQTWFDDPGGFDAMIYQGGTAPMSDFALSPTETAQLDLRATDPGLKSVLRDVALAALATDPAFGLTQEDQRTLFEVSGQSLLANRDDVTGLQARVGFVEARIDSIASRNAAELTSLSMARTALLEADPFEAATKLEEVQFQLQSLYSVTVRMSQLSLVNFL